MKLFIIMQVLLVTGGRQGSRDSSIPLDSTEVLEINTWRKSAPLPSSRYGLKAASLGNTIFLFGEKIFHIYFYFNSIVVQEDIMELLNSTPSWNMVSLTRIGWQRERWGRRELSMMLPWWRTFLNWGCFLILWIYYLNLMIRLLSVKRWCNPMF